MPDYVIILRPSPAMTTPDDVALRRFLKDAIRQKVTLLGAMRGLQCLDIREVEPEKPPEKKQ